MALLGTCWWFVAVLGLMAFVTPEQVDVNEPKGDVHMFYLDPWPTEQSTDPATISRVSAACPTNVCENGGRCTMFNGQLHCVCKPGFMGDRCQDLQLQLSCDPDRMTFHVLKSALHELNVNLSALHLSNLECKLLDTSELYAYATLTHENHTLCGTKVQVNGSHLIYTNELSTSIAKESQVVPSAMISRSLGIQIGFSCIYRYDKVVSLPFPLITGAALVTFVVKEGEFNVTMTLHPTEEYLEPYDYPPVIPLNRHLYVQLHIHGHGPQNFFTLKLEECWATPWVHHDSAVRHLLIRNGIADDSTVDIIDSGNQSLSRFSLQMFRFIQYQEVYLHCRIWLCQYNMTHCHQQPSTGRHKRDLSDPYRKVVSCGPIQLVGGVRTSMEEPESGLNTLVLSGSFAAGVVLLILSSVGFAKAFKKMTGLRSTNLAHVERL
ncbi:pancreatic secretory granule membrane major glycoprotein GP2-like [Hyla sarda]|uniref:pancreatic secretory granule membrane major glycoprotein GP2-like n=1 Tax=Hyla sarda TaxID=327740 RepID=UPI0024C2C2DE|nr:pancreatic secretory granule membrane major glycoprotein GP2-like [Hyla sarda]